MKLDMRWQVLLALAGLSLTLSILAARPVFCPGDGEEVASGFCVEKRPVAGGILVEGVVGAPRYPNPLLSDPNPVDRELVNLIYDGLTAYDQTGQLVPALARSWSVAEDGRTIQFELRNDVRWHDGEPFTARDVVATYSLLQDDTLPVEARLRALWQSVTITAVDDDTLTFGLSEPYAPFLEATTRGIMPAHLLAGVTGAELPEQALNRAPVGTGPLAVVRGNDWQRQGFVRLTLNPHDRQREAQLEGLEFHFYPSDAAVVEAYQAGEVQAISNLTPVLMTDAGVLPDIRLFSSAENRYVQLLFNLNPAGPAALRDLRVRQALAYALDREALIHTALKGEGAPLNGPYLPDSPVFDPSIGYYPTQVLSATQLLDDASWLLPAGQTVRQQALDAGEAPLPLQLRLLTFNDPTLVAVGEALAAQWRAIGVGIDLVVVTPEDYRNFLALRQFDLALALISPGHDPDLYDFWSQAAIVSGQNYAGWNNRRASEALEAGRQAWDMADRRKAYQVFQRYFHGDLPALTLYQPVQTFGLSSAVQGGDIGRITQPRDRYITLPAWTVLFRQVAVPCPAGS